MDHARSADGTRIGYERSGSGPVLVIVNGALSVGTGPSPLPFLLDPHFTLVRYDRRGRGSSGDAAAYAPTREVEDLSAVMDAVGRPGKGGPFVFGHSGGAILALEGAMAGLRMARVAVNEPPYILEGTRSRPPLDITGRLEALLAAGDREGALRVFLVEQVGLPQTAFEGIRGSPAWPGMLAIAHTCAYDSALAVHSELPADRLAALSMPVLVLTGGSSFPWIGRTAAAVADAIPRAELRVLEGQPHSPAPDVLAPELIRFFLA